MTKKSFVIILVLSVVMWFISTIIQALVELYVKGGIGYSFFGGSCSVTGYPIAVCADSNNFFYYLINIIFWFVIIWLIWKIFFKNKSRVS